MRCGLVLVAATLLLQTAVSRAAEEGGIGSASAVKNRVEGTIRGQTRALSSGSAVYLNESIRTGQDSIAELGFVDSTKLSVGPTSEVRLNKFVYDPNKGAGAVALKATRGSMRFVTGVQDHDSYSIKTPICDPWSARYRFGNSGQAAGSYAEAARPVGTAVGKPRARMIFHCGLFRRHGDTGRSELGDWRC